MTSGFIAPPRQFRPTVPEAEVARALQDFKERGGKELEIKPGATMLRGKVLGLREDTSTGRKFLLVEGYGKRLRSRDRNPQCLVDIDGQDIWAITEGTIYIMPCMTRHSPKDLVDGITVKYALTAKPFEDKAFGRGAIPKPARRPGL